MRVTLSCFALLLVSCASTHDSAPDAAAGDAAPPEDSGVYHQGAYTCCGQGMGVSCCDADAGLLGSEVLPDGAIVLVGDRSKEESNCFPYGGEFGDCVGSGLVFDGKDICTVCCRGLSRINATRHLDGGTCKRDIFFTCAPCGNGVCDEDESICTCPADCH